MLLWGVAALIPLLIHLWSRRKQQEVQWAAMEFLLAALHKQSRRMRFEQFLLLALRTLILTLFVVALARPVSSLTKDALLRDVTLPRTHTVLVLDSSYSMQFLDGPGTLFEAAQQVARNLTAQGRPGDGFSLILMGDPPEAIIGEVVYQTEVIRAEIDALKSQPSGANLPATLALIAERLAIGQRQGQRFDRYDICFLTDLGSTTWQAAGAPAIAQIRQQLPAGSRLLVFPIGPAERANAAIRELEISETLTAVGRTLQLDAVIENWGTEPIRRQVELTVDGRLIERREVSVDAGSVGSVRFQWLVDSPGEHRIEATMESDSLALDDRRQAIIVAAETIRVLCVAGRPGAADFISWALAPDAEARSQIAPEICDELGLLDRDLESYRAVFLCNVERLAKPEATALQNFVQAGGGLITILGDQVATSSYNAWVGRDNELERLLPARLGSAVSGDTYHLVPRYDQPIAASFRGYEQSGLVTVPIWHYLRLEPVEGAIEHLALDSGDPALLSCRVGAGRSLLLATAASQDVTDRAGDQVIPWNALVAWPSFPPLVHELLWYALGGRAAARNCFVGEPLLWEPLAADQVPREIIAPDQSHQPIEGRFAIGEPVWAAARQLGVYRLLAADTDQGALLYSVRLATQESNPQAIEPHRLPDFFLPSDERARGMEMASDKSSHESLFRWVLAAVFVLLVGESSLACWLGRRS
jgi:hypothetical protein